MISLSKNFLFIHVPKTGGNSIQNVLSEYSEDNIVSVNKNQDGVERFEIRNQKYNITKHSTLKQYKNELDNQTFKALYKFATIRNPWDMCISYFFSPHRGQTAWDRNEFIEFVPTIPTIEHYTRIETTTNKIFNKLMPRYYSEVKAIDHDIDFLIRFEHLNEDFKKVCERIEIPFVQLPHRNKSSRMHYTEYYDDELIRIVKNRFSKEIDYAKYRFGE